MSINRRRFLQTPLLGAAGTLPLWLTGCDPSGNGEAVFDDEVPTPGTEFPSLHDGYSQRKFEALYDESFYLYDASNNVLDVRLAEVEARSLEGGVEQFSVLFQCEPDAALADGIYTFEHYAAGSCELFIQAIDHPSLGNCLAADFSLVAA